MTTVDATSNVANKIADLIAKEAASAGSKLDTEMVKGQAAWKKDLDLSANAEFADKVYAMVGAYPEACRILVQGSPRIDITPAPMDEQGFEGVKQRMNDGFVATSTPVYSGTHMELEAALKLQEAGKMIVTLVAELVGAPTSQVELNIKDNIEALQEADEVVKKTK